MAKLFTVKALAELFDKDTETIYRWIREGDVFPNAFKVKDGWYVPMKDVRALMKSRPDPDGMPGLAKQPPVRRSSSGKGFVRGW